MIDSFMEIYDPITGKKKKRKLKVDGSLQQQIQQNIQSVAPNPTRNQTMAYDARPHQMGTPRMQGYNGVNQGAKGFLANLVRQTPRVNPILQQLTQPQKKYDMPQFTTDDALSKEWFDTALKRIAVKNQMKMDLAKQQQLAKLAGDVMGAQATNARTMADIYSTDVNAKQKERYTNVLDNYYRGMLEQKQQQAQPTSDQLKVAKVVNERLKLFSKSPSSFIPEWNDLDSDSKRKALSYFAKTGQIPRVKVADDGFFGFGKKYVVEIPEQTEQKPINTETSSKAELPNGLKVVDMKQAPDGKRYIKAQDGNWYEWF